eukprot:SAG31_NODE_146_length_22601_cov_56.529192_21_plen_239_part_00
MSGSRRAGDIRTHSTHSGYGSPASERASKPLAEAVENTLDILLDSKIYGIEDRLEEQQKTIQMLEDRLAKLEGKNDASLHERLAELEERTAQLEEHSAEHVDDALGEVHLRIDEIQNAHTEVSEQLEGKIYESIELQLEGKASLSDFTKLEEKLVDTEQLLQEEIAHRHQEIEQINQVLQDLDLLFETRDAVRERERLARIEASLRKSVHRMSMVKRFKAFNAWTTMWKRAKRSAAMA